MKKTSDKDTKSTSSIIFTQEACDTTQVESVNKSKQQFIDNENKNLKVQICDLQTSLDINKGIICDLLQCKSLSQVEGAILRKMNDELILMRDSNRALIKQRDD